MANATAYVAMDMGTASAWYGTLTMATADHIQIASGGYVQNYYGSFSYSGNSISGGTLTSTDFYEYGQKIYEITGNFSAVTVANYVLSGNVSGLINYLFSGPDQFNGSSQNEVVDSGSGNDQVYGNGGNDVLKGGAGDDTLNGGTGNDSLTGGTGNDTIDGGADYDTAIYASTRANSTITKTATGWSVSSSADGVDSLSNVERLQFADKKIALDLSNAGNAGKAVEFVGMVAATLIGNTAALGTVVAIFDQGKSMHDVCQLAIDSGLIRNLSGSSSNLDLAKLVYRNVVGSEASADVASALAANLQGSGGSMTQADFLSAIAQLDLNQQHVNLVGLQTTGIEYA